MLSLLHMLFHPRREVERLRTRPHWVVSFVILSLLSVSITAFTHSSSVQITLQHLPPSATAEDKQIVREMFDGRLGIQLAFLPARLLMGWSAFALVLFFLSKVWSTSQAVRFPQVFSLEVHAEGSLVLAHVAAGVLVLLDPSSASAGFLRVPFGLDGLYSSSRDLVFATFLNSLNIFSLWYVVILGVGICGLYRLSPVKGILTALGAWGLTAVFDAGIMLTLRDALHFQI